MEATLTKKMNIDKTNWTLVKFGDVVYEPKETMKDIVSEGIEHVVGLEHITTDDIHLRNSAGIEESTTFSKKFAKGDVLFGRRRAYLRKAAQAPFGGICSGDITVFRAKETLLPKLLPFIVNNEKFFDYAIKHSAGGLSPRVKFKDLADYEFLLPPKDQQAQLAELLWALDEVIEREKEVLIKLELNLNSYLRQIFTSHIFNNEKEVIRVKSIFQTRWEDKLFPIGWNMVDLKDVVSNTQNGFAEGLRDDHGIPQLRMNNVTRDGRIDLEKVEMIPHRNNLERYQISENDILFCNTNSEDLVGKSIIATDEIYGFTFSNHFTRLTANDLYLTPKFLYLWLKFHFDIGLFERLCTKWIGQAAVQTESLMRLKIILPSILEQNYASNYCQQIENRIDLLKSKIAGSKALQKSIINQVF
jgi:type I restriction enzyme S subunit